MGCAASTDGQRAEKLRPSSLATLPIVGPSPQDTDALANVVHTMHHLHGGSVYRSAGRAEGYAHALMWKAFAVNQSSAAHVAFLRAMHKTTPMTALDAALSSFDTSDAAVNRGSGYFFAEVIPVMADAVKHYEQIMSTCFSFNDSTSAAAGQHPRFRLTVDAPDIVLSKQQCFSILSAAFFSLFPALAVSLRTGNSFPRMNMTELMFSSSSDRVAVLKLRLLLDYYYISAKRYSSTNRSQLSTPFSNASHGVRVMRVCETRLTSAILAARKAKWVENTTDAGGQQVKGLHRILAETDFNRFLTEPVVRAEKKTLDNAPAIYVRVCSTSSQLDGCEGSRSAVADGEWLFWTNPETQCARLFHTPLNDREALMIVNAERFSCISDEAYNSEAEYGGILSSDVGYAAHKNNVIVAADPLSFDNDRQLRRGTERLRSNVLRELVKLSASLEHIPNNVPERRKIATGNWGFKSGPSEQLKYRCASPDPQLMFMIQWLACSLVDAEMHFFPYSSSSSDHTDDSVLCPSVCSSLTANMVARGVTCGDLLQCLITSSEKENASTPIFDLCRKLGRMDCGMRFA